MDYRVPSMSSVLNSAIEHRDRSTLKNKQIAIKPEVQIHPSIAWRLHEFSVKQKWKEIVGPLFANAVTAITLKGKVLMISVNSSTIRQELLLNKGTILERLNQELHKNVVTDMLVQ